MSRSTSSPASRQDHHASPEDVEQYAYDDRFEGFVLHPAHDGLPDGEVLSALADVELPVLVHAGRRCPPSALARSVLAHDVPTILARFGGYPLQQALMTAAIDLLEEFDNCYLETSFVRFREPLERALMEHPDRILFGSGAPGAHPNVAIMEILTLDVPEDAMHKVFSNNAGRVIEELAPRSF